MTSTTSYSVFVRGLGQPEVRGHEDVCDRPDAGATIRARSSALAVLTIARQGPVPKFVNASKQLLYIYADLDGDGDVDRAPLFVRASRTSSGTTTTTGSGSRSSLLPVPDDRARSRDGGPGRELLHRSGRRPRSAEFAAKRAAAPTGAAARISPDLELAENVVQRGLQVGRGAALADDQRTAGTSRRGTPSGASRAGRPPVGPPRYSSGLVPRTSMIGTEALRTTLGPITAPSPMRTPSTTIAREPTKAPSSMMRGLRRLQHAADADAAGEVHVPRRSARRSPPSPTCPPSSAARSRRRCSRSPASATPGEESCRSAPPRRGRHVRRARRRTSADLVEEPDRAGVDRLHLAQPEVEQDRLLRPLVHHPVVVPPSATRTSPRSSKRIASSTARDPPRRCPQLVDPCEARSFTGASSRISAARSHSASVGTSANRT